MFQFPIYSIIGIVTGISMGSLGVGAGIISIPLMIKAGLNIKQAVGAGMVMQLLPQSIPGVINYWDNIVWGPTIALIIGSFVGIWLGSYIVSHNMVSEKILYKAITIILLCSSIYFFYKYW
jgi:uncharacterized membrane protein YfcA